MPRSVSPLYYLGASYKTAPIRLLERLSVDEQDHDEFVQHLSARLRAHHPEAEVVVLGTCNRIEVYWTEGSTAELYEGLGQENGGGAQPGGLVAVGQGGRVADGASTDRRKLVKSLIAESAGLDGAELDAGLEFLRGRAAAEHLFRVAAGIESLVVGEHQILGQVEQALTVANQAGTAGPSLGTLFAGAIRCGRRCRLETSIGRNARDVSSVAVALAENLVGDLSRRKVLVAGMGEMGRLTVKALHHRGVTSVEIVNRGVERAREIAERWGATVKPMSEMQSLLSEIDILITSTASRQPILKANEVRSAMMSRPDRPLVLIDLAVPRDVDPAAAEIAGVHLFDLDGLKEAARQGERERRGAVPAVEKIICEELQSVQADLGDRAVRPVLSELWSRAETIRSEVVASTEMQRAGLTSSQLEVIDRMTRLLTNKLLHSPSAKLRSETTNGRAIEYSVVLRELFGLQSGERTVERPRDESES